MPIKYRTYFNEPKIEAVEITKETDKSVFFGKEREQKRSSYQNWHDSFEDAKTFLLEAAKAELCQIEVRKNQINRDIKIIESLKESK